MKLYISYEVIFMECSIIAGLVVVFAFGGLSYLAIVRSDNWLEAKNKKNKHL
jgi:hypothetical protein